jgi:hypothetical protein
MNCPCVLPALLRLAPPGLLAADSGTVVTKPFYRNPVYGRAADDGSMGNHADTVASSDWDKPTHILRLPPK